MSGKLRIVGIIVGFIVIVLVILVAYILVTSNEKINTVYEVEGISIDIPTGEEALAEGKRIFLSRRCADCHSRDGGGNPTYIDSPIFAAVGSANLTSGEGGVGQTYDAEDYIRAIQRGVDADGKALFIMPAQDWQQMPEAELAPLVAYILSLEPVNREIPEPQLGIAGRALMTFGELPFAAEIIDQDNAGLPDIETAATVEYGAYVALGCASCHGENYGGGMVFDEANSIAPNISSHEDGLGNWSLEDFTGVLRSGIRLDNSVISTAMPWQSFTYMSDVEIEAIYLFLQSVEPVADSK